MRIPGTRNPNSYILHWQHSQFPPSELWSQASRWPSGIAVLTYHELCNLLRRKKPHFLFPIYLTTDAAVLGKKQKTNQTNFHPHPKKTLRSLCGDTSQSNKMNMKTTLRLSFYHFYPFYHFTLQDTVKCYAAFHII